MTAAVGRVVAGGATQAERDALARKVAAARSQQAPAPAPPPAPAPRAPRPRDRDQLGRPHLPPAGGRRWSPPRLGQGVNTGAGFVLGLLVWGWVVLPFLQGGTPRVKQVLMAKFLNKTPDGKWLP